MSECDDEVETQAPAAVIAKPPTRGRKRSTRVSFSKCVTFCTVDTKYEVVKELAKQQGFRLISEESDRCNIYW